MQVSAVLETAVYVSDVARAVAFYERLFEFETLDTGDGFHAFSVGERSVLLLFAIGTTNVPKPIAGGVIPPHEGQCGTHFAFSIRMEDLARWQQRLAEQGIALESRVTWPRGGTSLYFRDPDNNLLELVTPGLWTIY